MSKTTGTTKFGWCLDGHHDGCRTHIGDKRCSCECHDMIGDQQ